MRLPITPATTLWRDLRDEVRRSYAAGRVLVAVEGSSAAAFADGLAAVFEEAGAAVFRASLDDFRRPRAEQIDSPEGVYRHAYDDATLRRVLLDPFREGGQTSATTGFQLAAFDAARDVAAQSAWVTGPMDAVLIVDGAWLLRPELRGVWHWSVALVGAETGEGSRSAALEAYRREARPLEVASALVDLSDPASPRRTFKDFC